MDHRHEILTGIERPSRYLGSEINTVRKDPSRVKLRFALAFPDLYEIGTSHFGLQILYHILNKQDEIAAERVFAPAPDMESRLRATGEPLFSLETRTPLNRFDIIGFSLLYELNFTNILAMLDLAGIPFRTADRDSRHPIIIAGGPCTCNPAPLAEFFDAMVIGDGEEVVVELARKWLEWKQSDSGDRSALLRIWSGIEGLYIPEFFEVRYDGGGFQSVVPRFKEYVSVKRAIAADLNAVPFPEKPVIPFGKPVHDRLRLEVSRGCSRGCRFCQAGMIYRPLRERSPETVYELAERSLASTGYEDISLLSLSTGDYGCIAPLMERLVGRLAPERVAVSLPSLRAGTLTPELMNLIKQVRKTGFTIAPEAGSQRLRDVINKNISEDEIIATVRDAFRMGWRLIKLYFMIGLPTESDEDLKAMVRLVRTLRNLKGPSKRRGQINVSLATFIPKPHTPFQWASQIALAWAQDKLNRMREELRGSGVEFKWQNPQMSLLEGVWARGDRRLSRLLIAAYRRGCRFDGWGDRFNFDSWRGAFDESGIDPEFYTTRARDLFEPLPWDHIDTRVSKKFLQAEWRRALAGEKTPDCREGDCSGCGVCDFDEIRPRVQRSMEPVSKTGAGAQGANPAGYRKLQVSYSKLGPARFFGHLEMVNIFLRALRRAGIPLKFSEGYHPKPKVAFGNPLPTGMESENETMIISIPREVTSVTLQERLNAQLPEGLRVHACGETIEAPADDCVFRVIFSKPISNSRRISGVDAYRDQVLILTSPKGTLKKMAVKDILLDVNIADAMSLEMRLGCEPGKNVRPTAVLDQVLGFSAEEITTARIRKLKTPEKPMGERS